MTPRRKRMLLVLSAVGGVAIAAALALNAFQENLLYYYSPSQVVAGEVPLDDQRRIRVGGLVVDGSIQREMGELGVVFEVTDEAESVTVAYDGILPNLFKEGQGVIAHGRFDDDGLFVADQILAKHDENYMAPEVKDSLRETEWQRRQHEQNEGSDY
ncbi:cytochrome c-type biogenesis protein CcmE [Natronospira proteinivora]|uniref:Cytochrome c-type biogenesis protein CcmE n=1 Tax=Natronospira proteinivora TaxID=1807133 RepID=A0ABT1G6V4_9GAMM|nr:cytochrome c maturation protein CcmE [Natronospira proteinivora]MCP1726822.1 cytochrome c-type biogenesis protein CcmE [Natronospira proteinivora]